MNSVLVCEGFDEVMLLGYYLHKTANWNYEKDGKMSNLYDVPRVSIRNQRIEIYKKNSDCLAIWCTGGKDNIKKPFDFVKSINQRHPQEGIDHIFVLMDRDSEVIVDCLSRIQEELNWLNSNVEPLKNNECNEYKFDIERDRYQINVIPIILPFDEPGAIESILMSAMAEENSEKQYIVNNAKRYVNDALASNQISNFLKHEREILKSKFSSVISITNPDRSTALFDALLMSNDWENSPLVRRHFQKLNELLGV